MKKIMFVVAALATFISQKSIAQENLSLSEAISMGLANNYDIKIEKQNVSAAELNNNWGQAGRYPSLNFTLSNNNSLMINNNNPTSPVQGTIPSTGISPTVNVDWVLFNGFKVRMTKARLDFMQKESEGNADIVISNTIQTIVLGYYQALLEQGRLKVLKKNMSLSKDKYQYLKLKNQYGSSSQTELLLEEGNYLSDSVNYINQELMYKNAIRNLNMVLAVQDVDQQYFLTEELNIPKQNFDKETLTSRLENQNVDLKKMYISQEILRKNAQISRADRYPTLGMNGSYNYNKNWNNLNSLRDNEGNEINAGIVASENTRAGINFRLTFNLFNGGKINRAIKQAAIQENIGKMRIDKMKLSLRKDLSQSLDQYNNRKQILSINERKLQVAESNLKLNEEKYKNGSINSFDYRRIQMNALQAEFEALQAKFNLVNANLGLMRLTGGILESYQK